MTWTPDIVRARFVEACDTAWRQPRVGPSQIRSASLEIWHSYAEVFARGSKSHLEDFIAKLKHMPPSAAAISRMHEVLAWNAELIRNEDHRRVMLTWATCIAAKRSFAAKCREEGWVKVTAYRRRDAVANKISAHLHMSGVLVRYPDEKWVLPEQPISSSSFDKLALSDDDEPPVSRTHWKGDEAAEDRPDLRDFSWAQSQARREAKRRQKLGLDAA